MPAGASMRHLLLTAASTVLLIAQVGASQARSYDCLVTAFFHDDRYPLSDDRAGLNKAMTVKILDAGAEIVVDTQVPGELLESRSIEVTERTADKVVANWQYEDYYKHALTLQAPANLDTDEAVTGTLTYRTYETDHSWTLRCAKVAVGQPSNPGAGR